MKIILFFLIVFSASLGAAAQTNDLAIFEKARINIDKKGMLVLGSWATANIITGLIATNTNNRQHRYFHQMNVIWNASNLLLAGAGYWGATKEKTDGLTLSKLLRHQNTKEKTFLFNVGLDVAYITGGLYLTERSRRNADPAKLKGYGNAVMMQGGFLLLFDAVMYTLHHRHGKELAVFTDKVTLVGTGAGITLSCKL